MRVGAEPPCSAYGGVVGEHAEHGTSRLGWFCRAASTQRAQTPVRPSWWGFELRQLVCS
jgi:hypothetical protein